MGGKGIQNEFRISFHSDGEAHTWHVYVFVMAYRSLQGVLSDGFDETRSTRLLRNASTVSIH